MQEHVDVSDRFADEKIETQGGGRGLRSSRTGRWQSWDGSQVSRPTVRTVPEEASVGRDVSWLLKEGGI